MPNILLEINYIPAKLAGDAKKISVCLFLDRLFLNRCLLDQVNYTFSASERRGVIPFKLKGNVKA